MLIRAKSWTHGAIVESIALRLGGQSTEPWPATSGASRERMPDLIVAVHERYERTESALSSSAYRPTTSMDLDGRVRLVDVFAGKVSWFELQPPVALPPVARGLPGLAG